MEKDCPGDCSLVNNSPVKDYDHMDDHAPPTYEMFFLEGWARSSVFSCLVSVLLIVSFTVVMHD